MADAATFQQFAQRGRETFRPVAVYRRLRGDGVPKRDGISEAGIPAKDFQNDIYVAHLHPIAERKNGFSGKSPRAKL
jgi:hypothetical protein